MQKKSNTIRQDLAEYWYQKTDRQHGIASVLQSDTVSSEGLGFHRLILFHFLEFRLILFSI